MAFARLCPSLVAFHRATENTKIRGGKAGNNNARMWQSCQSAESFPGAATATLATRLSSVLARPKAFSTNSALRTTRRQATSDDDAKGARPKPQSPSKNYVNFPQRFSPFFPVEQQRQKQKHRTSGLHVCLCQSVCVLCVLYSESFLARRSTSPSPPNPQTCGAGAKEHHGTQNNQRLRKRRQT